MIAGLARSVRTEPGDVVFEPHREVDDPNDFVVIEKCYDEDAFQTHLNMSDGEPFNDRFNEFIVEPHSMLTFLEAVELGD